MKIIVVDDESDALSNFLVSVVDEHFLEYKMFRSDPLSAVEYTRKNPVAAAFLDINMPKINGVDLAEMLVRVSPKIRIVFISGYTQDERAVKARLRGNLKGFCYKPYGADRLSVYLAQIAAEMGDDRDILIRTFGAFDVFVDGKPIKFSSAKSKELLALLVEKNGAHLTMGEAVSFLWPDKNAEYGKIRWRDAVWRLRKALSDYALESLADFSRAQAVIQKSVAKCDYWDALDGGGLDVFLGSYMPEYGWSIETQSLLDGLKSNQTKQASIEKQGVDKLNQT